MKFPLICFAFGAALVISSCAPVKFYSDEGLTKGSGLKYYIPKPYLQIERDVTNNNVVKATVIYLPDLSRPGYLVIKDGFGSRKVDVKLAEGILTDLGVATDPMIDDNIEALAALVSKSSEAVSELSSLKGLPPGASQTVVCEIYEILMGPDGTQLRKVEFK